MVEMISIPQPYSSRLLHPHP